MNTWMWSWIGICIAVGIGLAVAVVGIGRSVAKRPVRVIETGHILTPVVLVPTLSTWRRVGAGIVSGSMGKVHASWPLAVLELAGGEISLWVRPRLLAALFGARPFHARPGSDVVAFPARGWFGSMYVGIRAGKAEGYFMTGQREELLATLEQAGFAVAWAEQKITYP